MMKQMTAGDKGTVELFLLISILVDGRWVGAITMTWTTDGFLRIRMPEAKITHRFCIMLLDIGYTTTPCFCYYPLRVREIG